MRWGLGIALCLGAGGCASPSDKVADDTGPPSGTETTGATDDTGVDGGATEDTGTAPAAPDGDGDGFDEISDCDDGDATVYPGAPELCDAQPNDCDAESWLEDEGVASFFGADGAAEDWTGALSGASLVTLDAPGTLSICPGEWTAALWVEADVAILGAGSSRTALSGGGLFTPITIEGPDLEVTVSGLTLRDGQATTEVELDEQDYISGGGLLCMDAVLVADDLRFVENRAPVGGGLLLDGCDVSLSDLHFVNNTADFVGGAMTSSGSSGALNGGSFTNSSAVSGGALMVFESTLSLTNVDFTDNSGFDGGGVDVQYSTLTLSGGSFLGNTSNYGGGLVSPKESAVALSGVHFEDNEAYQGGGIYLYETRLTANDCTFVDNAAEYGGGVDANLADVVMSGGGFTGNQATHGGGLGLWDGSLGELTGVSFVENRADENGGGALVVDSSAALDGGDFTGNRAADDGGAIYLDRDAALGAIGVTFYDNLPDDTYMAGEGSYNWGPDATFSCADGPGCL